MIGRSGYSTLFYLMSALALGNCNEGSSINLSGSDGSNGKDAGHPNSNINEDGGPVPVSCTRDSQCGSFEVCRSYRCVAIAPSSTPQVTYDDFVSALKNNDLEGTLKYFHPGTREVTRDSLVGKDLGALGLQLEGLTLQNCSRRAQECTIAIDGEEYVIQLILVKDAGGQEVYKIRNF